MYLKYSSLVALRCMRSRVLVVFYFVVLTKEVAQHTIISHTKEILTILMISFFQVALPIRLKSIHILNSGMATQMLMKMVQRFANAELLEKVFIELLTYNIMFYNTKLPTI